jgi:Tfp pilus assembly protein PilV
MIEVMAAIFLLMVGAVSMALLSSTMVTKGRQSKYVMLASTLTSEKLEDLNRWPGNNQSTPDVSALQICVPTGSTSVGSLTSDILQTTTCPNGGSGSLAYYDDVSIDFSNNSGNCSAESWGCFAETVSSVSAGNTVYTTTAHSPDGTIITSQSSTAPTSSLVFHRRWIIEANVPVTGTRRLTVLTSLPNTVPPVTFQMSIVRP